MVARPVGGLQDAGPQAGVTAFFRFVRGRRRAQKVMLSPMKSPSFPFDRARLEETALPILRAHGAELYDLEFKTEQGQWVFRVLIERAGAQKGRLSTQAAAVDLETCANISRELSPALDALDVIPHRYNLEVGSPGLERTLRSRDDYERFSGHKAKLRVMGDKAGVVVGRLSGVEGDTVVLDDGTIRIPLGDVMAGKLVFEFGGVKNVKKAPGRRKAS